jgi:hypothetical protein
MKIPWSKKSVLFIFPGLILIWTIFLTFYHGPYYLRNIDPEYVYLISGLNSAMLDFNMIGHVDHPGTPLQLLTGLSFRIIHLLTGHNDILTDVLSNPELYLSLSNIILTGLSIVLIFRLGILVYRFTSSMPGALVLQAFYFYTAVHFEIHVRYTPDRMLLLILTLFLIFYIRHLYDNRFTIEKFSVLSGLVMGIGLITKFSFAPMLVLPLFIIPGWKHRLYYMISAIVSACIVISPIFSRLPDFVQIIKNWTTHTGLYGTGESGIIDQTNFLKNISQVLTDNPSFTIITILGGLCILLLLIRPNLRRANKDGFLLLLGAYVCIFLNLMLIGKHYKSYYALPVLSLIPVIFYSILRLFENSLQFRYKTLSFALFFGILLIFPAQSMARKYSRVNTDLQDKRITEAFIRDHTDPGDYFIISPNWMASPMPGSAMALGVSWFRHRDKFYLDFKRVCPNWLTWEGKGNPLRFMRMRDVNFEEALLSGYGMHIYTKPGWNAPEICEFVESYAHNAGIQVKPDTIYSNENILEYIISYRNMDGWKRSVDLASGFEKHNNDRIYCDNGVDFLGGRFILREGISANGNYSIELGKEEVRSPTYLLKGIMQGDVVSSSIKSNISEEDNIEHILITCEYTDINGDLIKLVSGPSPGKIHEDWFMSELYAKINSQPADSSIVCYVEYTGDYSVRIDDFMLKIYSR